MIGRLLCGLCESKAESKDIDDGNLVKDRHGERKGKTQTRVDIASTSHDSLNNSKDCLQDFYESFKTHLRNTKPTDFFKAAMVYDQEGLNNDDFNKKLWDKLYFMEKMVTHQILLTELIETKNQIIRSWTHSEKRIESV